VGNYLSRVPKRERDDLKERLFVDAETKNTRVFVDPPSGWKYGFPKQAPTNLRKMDSHDLTSWLVENGYPIEEAEYWSNSPKFGSVPCRFIEMEITDES
jgi:hypothetical protein